MVQIPVTSPKHSCRVVKIKNKTVTSPQACWQQVAYKLMQKLHESPRQFMSRHNTLMESDTETEVMTTKGKKDKKACLMQSIVKDCMIVSHKTNSTTSQ